MIATSVKKNSKGYVGVFLISVVIISVTGQEWSSCSATCGGGVQRKEVCLFGFCSGYEQRLCNTFDCVQGYSVWSACTKSCGSGTQFKVEPCNLNITHCPKTYQDCNTAACPSKSCGSHQSHRFEDKSSCCDKSNTETCGTLGSGISSRIIGGEASSLGQWPWAIVLKFKKTNKQFCGATLINSKFALTAGHCVARFKEEDITATLGVVTLTFPEASAKTVGIKKFTLHNLYSDPLHDIAMIEFKTFITTSNEIRPACLPQGERVPIGTKCYAVGWGIARVEDIPTRVPSDHLMHVGLHILPIDVCITGYRDTGYRNSISINQLCAGRLAGGVDTCRGDSGGPLICQRCQNCNWFLAGVTSFGPTNCGQKGRPGIYTNVVEYEPWIRRIAKIENLNYYIC